MAKEIKPGVTCRVISSSRGPNGSSVGRLVKVVDQADPPIHIVWGEMWDCEALDGKGFDVKITSPDMQTSDFSKSNNATFAGDWLEPLEDEPPKDETRVQEKELTN